MAQPSHSGQQVAATASNSGGARDSIFDSDGSDTSIIERVTPKIYLYTYHHCPFAHRAHIALSELRLPYTETIIDLSKPRDQWYLSNINPRGLVPSLEYSSPDGSLREEILTESAVVVQFLCDAHPSHLLPRSHDAPLFRARVHFFVATWEDRVSRLMYPVYLARAGAAKEALARQWYDDFAAHLDPLLHDAAPFFAGSREFTLAEVMLASFLLRIFAFSDDGVVVPKWFGRELRALGNFGPWAEAVMARPSVREVWDEEGFVSTFKERLLKATGS